MVGLWRCRRGLVALEFSLIGMALLAMLLLVLEVAWQMAVSAGLDHGARQASRWAATGQAPPAGRTQLDELRRRVVESSGLPIDNSRLAMVVESFAAAADLTRPGTATPGMGGSGEVMRYRITYDAAALTPVGGALLTGGRLPHRFTVIVRNEPYAIQ